ncbi:hypothetical protein TNCV_976321 [Trichonephila clavipes]|nr:hypothetical protein TNCV_976321 [Trichonephila clavipes]
MVPQGTTVKQQHYTEILKKFGERGMIHRFVRQQLVDFAPRQRLGTHCVLCKTIIVGQTHQDARTSAVLTNSRPIRL